MAIPYPPGNRDIGVQQAQLTGAAQSNSTYDHLTQQEKPATVSTQSREFTHSVPTAGVPRRAGEITGAAGLMQQAPQASQHPAIWPLVIKDMAERDNFGREKYKQRLQGFNGRDMLTDAYQEVLDLAVYLRGALYERDRC